MATDITVIPYDNNTALTLTNCNIDSFAHEAVLAADGMTVESTRFAASGTCIINGTTSVLLAQKLEESSQRCSTITMDVGGTNLIGLNTSNSNIKGPFLKLTATQVVGGQGLALVRWEINDQYPVCGDTPLLSHTWTQRMNLDAAGVVTRTVTGTLRAYMAKDGTSTVIPANGTGWFASSGYADLFRRPILPDVPGYGWRRESQEFAYDAASTALVYQFTDKQHAYDLPDGVRVGDMEFAYERSLDNPGVANITFSCDLQGDKSLTLGASSGGNAYTGNRYLLASAIALSKTRINANYGNVLITRLRVIERNMLSGYAIRLEIDAQAFPKTQSGTETAPSPIAWMIGQRFSVTRTLSRTMDSYGPFASTPILTTPAAYTGNAYYMVPHWISNSLQDMECPGEATSVPKSLLTMFTGTNTYGVVNVAVGVDTTGMSAINDQFVGRYEAAQKQNDSETHDGINYAQIITHNVALTNANYTSGVVRMSVMYLDKADVVLQVAKPTVRVREHIEVAKANTAPSRILRPLPTGAILISENWDVSFGKFDQQGQRMFIGSFDREFEMYDPGGVSGNGFSTQSSVKAGQVRAWSAPSGTIAPTLAQIATNASQDDSASVFGAMPAGYSGTTYPVSGSTFVT